MYVFFTMYIIMQLHKIWLLDCYSCSFCSSYQFLFIMKFSSGSVAQLMIVGNPMRSQPEAPTEVVGGISDCNGSPANATATASLGMNLCT